MTKKNITKIVAAATCLAGLATAGLASAVFCFPASSAVAGVALPFGNSITGNQTWGCSVSQNSGSASGQGRSVPVSGAKQVCANLLQGSEVDVRGLDSSGNSIAGCRATDNVVGGGFTCDTTGCNSATQFDVTVES